MSWMTYFYYPTNLVFQWHQVVNDLFRLFNYSGPSVAPSREWPVSIIQLLWSFSGTKSWMTYFYYPTTLVFQWHQVVNDLFLLSNYSGLSVAPSREWPISIIQLIWSFSGTMSWMTYFYYPTTLVFQWHQVVNDLFLLSNYSGLSVAPSREWPVSIIQLLWSFSGTKSWMTCFYYPTTLVFQWHQVVNDLFLLSNYSGLSVAPSREWPVSIIQLLWSFSGTKSWMTCFYYPTTLVFQWHQVVNDLFLLSNYSGLSVAPSREWPVSIIQLLWSFSGTKSWMTYFYYPTTLVFQWHQVVNDLFLLSNYSGLSVAPSREWPISIIQLLWSFSGTKSWMTCFYYPTTLVFQWHQVVNDLFLLSNYSGLSVAPSREWPVSIIQLLWSFSGTKSWMTYFYYPTTLVFQWHQVVNDLFLLSNYSGLSVALSREWPISIIQLLWSFSGTKSWMTYFYYPTTLVFQWHQVVNDLFLLSNYSGLSVAPSREWPISIIQLLWSFSGTKSWMTYFYYPTTLVFQWHQVVNDLFLLSNYSGLSVALSREWPISIIQLLWSFSGTKSWMTYFYYPTTLVFQWHQVVNDLFLLSNYSGLSVAPRREWPVSIIHLFWSFSGTKWWMTCFYYSTTLVFQWHQVVNDLFLSNYSGLSVAPSGEWPVSIIQLLWSFSGTKSWMTCFYYPTTLVFQWHQVVNDLFLLSNYSGLSVAPSGKWPVSIIQLLWSFSGTKSWMTYLYYPTNLVFQWHHVVNDLFLLSN